MPGLGTHRKAARSNIPGRGLRAEAATLYMESYLIFVLFLVVWFFILPCIPGISRFT
jgi:hypothetical protein